ncbi:hypothetical protein [Moraxella marmotae]|uniref:hypothetical protein n=1 Tax=Moraxella marmotae TaxID=3344520 RepID=UPI0035F3F14A
MIIALFANTGIKLTVLLVLFACLLPYVCAVFANAAQQNHMHQTQTATNFYHAKISSFQSLPIFLGSVVVALYTFVPAGVINMLSLGFVLFRLGFLVSCLAKLPPRLPSPAV